MVLFLCRFERAGNAVAARQLGGGGADGRADTAASPAGAVPGGQPGQGAAADVAGPAVVPPRPGHVQVRAARQAVARVHGRARPADSAQLQLQHG